MTVIALALACRRNVEPPPAREPAARGHEHPGAPDHGPERGAADDGQPVPEGFCHPATVVSMGRGGAIIDACFDPQTNQTDLIGQRVDVDSMAVGSRVRLQRVAGNVLSLAATASDGGIRVAWISHVGEGAERSDEFGDRGGGTRELAVIALGASLEVIGVPILVNRHGVAPRMESERSSWSRSRVELAPGVNNSVLVLATDANAVCPEGRPRCATWSVFSVEADGTSRRMRHESTATPSMEPQSLIRVGEDLAYLRGSDAARNILHVHSVRAESALAPVIPAAAFDPLVDWVSGSLAWTGAAVVALGEERSLDVGEPRMVVRVMPLSGTSPTRARSSDEPGTVRWPLVTERSWRCVRRHPVLRIAWRGGAVELDPTAPGASIEWSRWVSPALTAMPARATGARWFAPMAWTGRALLAIDGQDRLHRWTCTRDGSVPSE